MRLQNEIPIIEDQTCLEIGDTKCDVDMTSEDECLKEKHGSDANQSLISAGELRKDIYRALRGTKPDSDISLEDVVEAHVAYKKLRFDELNNSIEEELKIWENRVIYSGKNNNQPIINGLKLSAEEIVKKLTKLNSSLDDNATSEMQKLSCFSSKFLESSEEIQDVVVNTNRRTNCEGLLGMTSIQVDEYFQQKETIAICRKAKKLKEENSQSGKISPANSKQKAENIENGANSRNKIGTGRRLPLRAEHFKESKKENTGQQGPSQNTEPQKSSKEYPNLDEFLKLHPYEAEISVWMELWTTAKKLSVDDLLGKLANLGKVTQLSLFARKFQLLQPTDQVNFLGHLGKNISILICMDDNDVDAYFECVKHIMSKSEERKTIGLEDDRDSSYFEAIKVKQEMEMRSGNKYTGKYVHLRSCLKEVPLNPTEKNFFNDYLNDLNDDLLFQCAETIISEFSLHEDKKLRPVKNVVQGVRSIIEKLYQVKTSFEGIDQFLRFLMYSPPDSNNKDTNLKEFLTIVLKLNEFSATSEEKQKLRKEDDYFLKKIRHNTLGNVCWDDCSMFKSFREHCKKKQVAESDLELDVFLTEAVEFLKFVSGSNTVLTVPLKNRTTALVDISSKKYIIYEARRASIAVISFSTNWNAEKIPDSEKIISLIERTAISRIIYIYKALRTLAKSKKLELTQNDRSGVATETEGERIDQKLKCLVAAYGQISFQDLDKAVHHFAKHPHTQVYLNKPIDPPVIVDSFFEKTSQVFDDAVYVHFYINSFGISIDCYIHETYYYNDNGLLVSPKTLLRHDISKKGLESADIVILLLDQDGDIYLKTCY